eukprot:tig00001126_g7116.t1
MTHGEVPKAPPALKTSIPTSRTVEVLSYYNRLNEQIYTENFAEGGHHKETGENFVKKSYPQRVRDYLTDSEFFMTLTYLVLLGVIMACVSLLYAFIEGNLAHLHHLLSRDEGRPFWLNQDQGSMRLMYYVMSIAHTVFWAGVAASFPAYISKLGAGSGIPELKAIISGMSIARYLSMRTLICKFMGLVLGAGAGLFTGREGPFVCLGGCVANLLAKIPGFREKFLRNAISHRSILAAGAAVGIVSTFGTTVGGVIFSLEVTASFYMVSEVWKCFLTCMVASIMFQFARFHGRMEAIAPTHFDEVPWDWTIFLSIGVGILSGMAGALFNILIKEIGLVIKHQKKLVKHPVLMVMGWALITGIVSWPFGQFLRNEWDETMNAMFSKDDLRDENEYWYDMFGGEEWSIVPALFLMFVTRLVMTCTTICMPLPTGIFVPTLCMGSIIGRLYGEILMLCGVPNRVPPGIFALIGSAAMCAGVTHSIAVAVILLEITGQFYHVLHVLLGTLVALSVSSSFCPSYYEQALVKGQIPYLPFLVDPNAKDTAHDLMSREVQFLDMSAPLKELRMVLKRCPDFIAYPMVDNRETMTLVGSIRRGDLQRVLEQAGVLQAPQKSQFQKNMDKMTNTMTSLTQRVSRSISVHKISGSKSKESIAPSASKENVADAHSGNGTPTNVGPAGGGGVPLPTPPPRPPSKTPTKEAANGAGEASAASSASPAPAPATISVSNADGEGAGKPKHAPVNGPESLATVSAEDNSNVVYHDDDEEEMNDVEMLPTSPELMTLAQMPDLVYDRAPLQVPELTPRSRVHLLFTMLACSFIYVTRQGRLVGVLTKRGIIQAAFR